MIARLLPRSLQTHLLLAFGLLALLTAGLANGASLTLYGLRLQADAREAMSGQALTIANVLAAGSDEAPLPISRMGGLIFADSRLRRAQQSLTVVDGQGRALASISPFPAGRGADRGPWRGPRELQTSLRPPFLPDVILPPTPRDDEGRPTIAEARTERGIPLLYTTIPLPVTVEPDAAWTELVGSDAGAALHLALVRPRAELSGLWRSLLPSVLVVGLVALALAMLVAWLLARSITRPVADLTAASARLAAGDYSTRVTEVQRPEELRRLARSFNSMARAVAESDRRQRDFVVNVGHDLRTPLTAVRGFAGALVDGTARSPEQRRRAVEAIAGSSERMTALIESLIDLARLEGQAADLQMVEVPAEDLLESVRETQAAAADLHRVTIELDVAEGSRLRVDPIWMQRALGNLVDNAIRHGPSGGRVRLEARPDRLADGREALRIEVRDEGPGIPAEDLPRIFDRFYRGDPARRAGGSGLGLAIAREIIEAHEGRIEAHSPPEGGACLRVLLPSLLQEPARA